MGQGKFLMTFLAGAAIGTVAAMLMAPDKGENTRANILDSSGDFFRRFKASYNDLIDNVTSALDAVADETEEVYQQKPHMTTLLDENVIATDGTNQL